MAEELGYSRDVSEPKPAARRSRAEAVQALLKEARQRFTQAQQADKPQRERELADLRFYADDQWPDEVRTARAGQNATNGLPPVPARPCLTINRLREPVSQVLNQERQADMGIELVPADDFEGLAPAIDDQEIELREGLIRRIQRESQAADARTWAFQRATIAGRGYYGVMTRYGQGKTWDQEVFIQRFYNQACVTLDPAHEQPDGSDAEWGFIGAWMPWDQYKAEFPSAPDKPNVISDATESAFKAFGQEQPEWVNNTEGARAVYVVDYYYTDRQPRELLLLADGSSAWADEAHDGVAVMDRRTVVDRSIKWAKLDGINDDVLDETDWPGRYIPIVKVMGEELQPYDKERRAIGLVRPARDSQEAFNAMVSKWVETVALAPIPPFQATPEQIEGFEDWYAVANTRTLPYLPYIGVSDAAGRLPPPNRTPVDTPVAAIAGSIQVFSEAIQSTTLMHDPALGRVDPNLKSGKAISQIVQQSQRAVSNFLDNLTRSIRHEATIINDLLYPIYGTRPGRLARLINGQGDAQSVLVGQPFTMQGGTPVPVGSPPTMAPPTMPMGGQPPAPVQHYKLTPDANFNIAIKVTRSFDTRREEEVSVLGDLLSANPQFISWFGDLFFKYQDGPGHHEMAERAKVMLAPPIQQLLAARAQGQTFDPATQAKLAQGQQMIQQLTAHVNDLSQQIQTKQVEQRGKLQIVQTQEQAETERADKDREAKLAVAALEGKYETLQNAMSLLQAEIARLGSQQHDLQMGAADAGHEEYMAQMAAQQAQQQQAQQVAGQAALADQGHQQALAQGQQAAALAPSPEGNGNA